MYLRARARRETARGETARGEPRTKYTHPARAPENNEAASQLLQQSPAHARAHPGRSLSGARAQRRRARARAARETARAARVGNGYMCGALDGLLAATCAAFDVTIVHDFVGEDHVYEVARPLRVAYLNSSEYHMRHVRNADASDAP